MDTTERVLDLLIGLLNARAPVPFEEIRRWFPEDYLEPAFEAARRKFERDKDVLLELGVPLRFVPGDGGEESGGGYLVDRDRYYLPELRLGADDVALVYLAGAALRDHEPFPYRRDLELALAKISLQAGDAGAGSPGGPGEIVASHPAARDGASLHERLDLLERAVRTRKRVRITYSVRYRAATSKRDVDPYGLFCSRGRWSLVGRCHERDDVRVFAVARILSLLPNTARPRSPDFEVPAGFRIRAFVGVPPWRFELHPPAQVTVDVQPALSFIVERRLGVRPAPAPGGWARFTVEATNTEPIADWALSLPGRVRIVAPAELAAATVQTLHAVLARYGEAP